MARRTDAARLLPGLQRRLRSRRTPGGTAVRIVLITLAPRVAEIYAAALPLAGHELAGVITMPTDRSPEGVGGELVMSDPELRDALSRLQPDVAVCNGWGFRISAATIAVPRFGIVNGHPSKLPRWRGPNPFGWTLRANDPELGFTWHRMDEQFDTGAVLAQDATPLGGDETAAELPALVAPLAAPLLEQALTRVEAGDPGDPQSEEGMTYAGRFEDEFAEIDWSQTAQQVHDQCRCWFLPTVSGILGPLTTLDGERVRVLETRLAGGEPPSGRLVQCADGPLEVVLTEPVEA